MALALFMMVKSDRTSSNDFMVLMLPGVSCTAASALRMGRWVVDGWMVQVPTD